ncbi:hypothetical protein MSUIS_05310 [Mycoplasma suis KI3806]|nr:hypothetical protein [Mycoplasma suis]CBZ40624.1 hypothetical protein MSUIS_05310 [Mycoplasma suis KI3806]
MQKTNFEAKSDKSLNFGGSTVEKLETKGLGQLSNSSSMKIEVAEKTELPKEEVIPEKKSQSFSIQEIFSAMSQEQKVQEFASRREAITVASKKKLTSSAEFREVFETLKINEQDISDSISREVKTVNPEVTYYLREEGRKALKTFFEEQINLRKQRDELTKDFDSSIGVRNRRSVQTSSSQEEMKRVVESLNSIGWTNQGLDWAPLFDKYGNKNFGDNDNPFRFLVKDEKDWSSWVTKVKKVRDEKQKYMDNHRTCGVIFLAFGGNSFCYPELDKYTNDVKKAEAEMEVLIGRNLFRKMKQS